MGFTRRTLKVTLSYVFDWVMIVLIAVVGALFTLIPGNHRAFSLADPDLSYPYLANETISTTTLGLLAFLFPAVVTVVVCLVFVPGPTIKKDTPKKTIWRRKLWEWNTAWLGLALACALAVLITDGLKILFGQPRPDVISRCDPDLSALQKYIVGGLGNKVREGQNFVNYHICQQTDQSVLADGFMSFPSGHSSFSWAGLGYLTLFVCAKFAVAVPYLLPGQYDSTAYKSQPAAPDSGKSEAPVTRNTVDPELRVLRSAAAAPPVYIVVLAVIPVGLASYICATRYTDYRHHAFDIICGSLIGLICAFVGFRWFHAPIRRGAGWSWGPRSASKAFGIGVGVQSYADDGVEQNFGGERPVDLERGEAHADESRNGDVS